jgi:hypothetical protein
MLVFAFTSFNLSGIMSKKMRYGDGRVCPISRDIDSRDLESGKEGNFNWTWVIER